MESGTLLGYQARQLTPSETPILRALIDVFGEAFESEEEYKRARPSDTYLAALLAKPHFLALAATHGDEVIGGLTAYELDLLGQDRREIFLYDLAVSESHRRRGVASQLINELRRIAARRGAQVIFVQADGDDIPAIALYESLGTKRSVYHFDVSVPS